jgi:hypothetical protein
MQLAEVATLIGETEDQKTFSAFGDRLKAAYFNHFYNTQTGVLAGWRSADGQCWGYEGFLVDGYLPMLAVYDWKK